MKNKTERDKKIYEMWEKNRLTYKQIAAKKLPGCLSLSRIRNIIYGGPAKLKSDKEKEIYRIFRLKFLELKDVHKAICFTHENQPCEKLSEMHIRRIIRQQLQQRRCSTALNPKL